MKTPQPTEGGSYIRDPKTGALLPERDIPREEAEPAPPPPTSKGGQ